MTSLLIAFIWWTRSELVYASSPICNTSYFISPTVLICCQRLGSIRALKFSAICFKWCQFTSLQICVTISIWGCSLYLFTRFFRASCISLNIHAVQSKLILGQRTKFLSLWKFYWLNLNILAANCFNTTLLNHWKCTHHPKFINHLITDCYLNLIRISKWNIWFAFILTNTYLSIILTVCKICTSGNTLTWSQWRTLSNTTITSTTPFTFCSINLCQCCTIEILT